MSLVPLFASESGVPVAAEPLFEAGNVAITNSMLTGAVFATVVIGMFMFVAMRGSVRPLSKFGYFIESTVEWIATTISSNFGGDDKKARKFAGLFIAFFVFILINNLSGLLPGFGGAIYATTEEGLKAALLRPFTTDLNGTLALATITMVTVQFYAVRARGLVGYFKHFFVIAQPWWNPMNLFLGPMEVLSEATRLITLALRLFGVIYAGEVLLHVIAELTGNFAWVGTVPIVLMEIFFASIQAYLFIMLSSVYLQLGTYHDEPQHSPSLSPNEAKAGEAK